MDFLLIGDTFPAKKKKKQSSLRLDLNCPETSKKELQYSENSAVGYLQRQTWRTDICIEAERKREINRIAWERRERRNRQYSSKAWRTGRKGTKRQKLVSTVRVTHARQTNRTEKVRDGQGREGKGRERERKRVGGRPSEAKRELCVEQ